jgi:serine protease AprX
VLNRIAVEKQINADYKHVDGTSFAAPIITSVVAQMLEANPDLTPADIKTVLCGTAVLLPNVSADVQGYGVVHPGAAVAAVVG